MDALEKRLKELLSVRILSMKVPKARNLQSVVTLFMLGPKEAGWPGTTSNRFLKQFSEYKPNKKPYRWYLEAIGEMYCYKCHSLKPLTELVSGKSSYCTGCDKVRGKKYREANKNKTKAYRDKHYELFTKDYIARNAKRRAAETQAVPSWANLQEITDFYNNCPVGHHVDHIIPLVHEKVCGLHVLDNLQYLLAEANLSKSNKFEV